MSDNMCNKLQSLFCVLRSSPSFPKPVASLLYKSQVTGYFYSSHSYQHIAADRWTCRTNNYCAGEGGSGEDAVMRYRISEPLATTYYCYGFDCLWSLSRLDRIEQDATSGGSSFPNKRDCAKKSRAIRVNLQTYLPVMSSVDWLEFEQISFDYF